MVTDFSANRSGKSTHGVVVVGAGQAAHEASTALRRLGYEGRIRVIGEEPQPPYQRPPLSKQFLTGDMAADELAFDTAHTLADLGIELTLGQRVTHLNLHERELSAAGIDPIRYDHLILATGARNRPFPHATPAGVHDVRTVEDSIALRAELEKASRLVVIGAGFLGLEVALAARSLGLVVDVIEMDHAMMARVLSSDSSEKLNRAHHIDGIRTWFRSAVVGFDVDRDDRVRIVELSTGEKLAADVVVSSVGVIPNTELALDAGLAVDNGICVDRHLRTSAPDVFAIGDCATFPWDETGRMVRVEAVSNAIDQGGHVAATIVGSDEPYVSRPWFWSNQGKQRIQIAGLALGADQHVLTPDSEDHAFSVLAFSGEKLVAVESCNRPRDHIAARRLLFAADGPPTFTELKSRDFDLHAKRA